MLSFDRTTRMEKIKMTIAKMLSPHSNISAANALSAAPPLPRLRSDAAGRTADGELRQARRDRHADIGIGNQPAGNPDWTFAANAGSYPVMRLRVLVHYR